MRSLVVSFNGLPSGHCGCKCINKAVMRQNENECI